MVEFRQQSLFLNRNMPFSPSAFSVNKGELFVMTPSFFILCMDIFPLFLTKNKNKS